VGIYEMGCSLKQTHQKAYAIVLRSGASQIHILWATAVYTLAAFDCLPDPA